MYTHQRRPAATNTVQLPLSPLHPALKALTAHKSLPCPWQGRGACGHSHWSLLWGPRHLDLPHCPVHTHTMRGVPLLNTEAQHPHPRVTPSRARGPRSHPLLGGLCFSGQWLRSSTSFQELYWETERMAGVPLESQRSGAGGDLTIMEFEMCNMLRRTL